MWVWVLRAEKTASGWREHHNGHSLFFPFCKFANGAHVVWINDDGPLMTAGFVHSWHGKAMRRQNVRTGAGLYNNANY